MERVKKRFSTDFLINKVDHLEYLSLALYHIESPPTVSLALYHIESPPAASLALYHIESPPAASLVLYHIESPTGVENELERRYLQVPAGEQEEEYSNNYWRSDL